MGARTLPQPAPWAYGDTRATRAPLPTTHRLAAQLAAWPPAACCAPPNNVHHGELQNGAVRADDELPGRWIFVAVRGLRAKHTVTLSHRQWVANDKNFYGNT